MGKPRKKWLDGQARKHQRLLSKGKRSVIRNRDSSHSVVLHRKVLSAPSIFSIIQNESETLSFFERTIEIINDCDFRDSLYFDLSNIEQVTPDALMYIIAIINNSKRILSRRIPCSGNLPNNEEAKHLIEEYGFYKYVSSSHIKEHAQRDDRVQIISGSQADGIVASQMCDFANSMFDLGGLHATRDLYRMILELMTNTKQHAYDSETSHMQNKWYIFAERNHEHIQFIFLDTGLGIPNTIKTKMREKILKGLGYVNDSKLIASTLKGEFRSETGEPYRGKGLPGIYRDIQSGCLSNLNIISCRGHCIVNKDSDIKQYKLSSTFEGTLFCWIYDKAMGGMM